MLAERHAMENDTGIRSQHKQGTTIKGHTLGTLEGSCATFMRRARARAAVRVETRRLEKGRRWLLGFQLQLVLRRLWGLRRRAGMRRIRGGCDITQRFWCPLLQKPGRQDSFQGSSRRRCIRMRAGRWQRRHRRTIYTAYRDTKEKEPR